MADPFRDDVPTTGVLPVASNPFRPGAGKVPPAFGGRTAPLRAAKSMVDRLAVPSDPVDMPVLRGVRGTGKTSLMAYVRRHAAAADALTLHIEADANDETLAATCSAVARDAAEVTDSVPARLGRRLAALDVKGKVEFHPVSETDAGSNIEALLDDIARLAHHAGRGVLLTVDEAHEAEKLLLRPLVRVVHRLGQDDHPFGVMISGLPGVLDTLQSEGQTYTERLLPHDLGLLDHDGTAEALRRPFREDADLDLDDDALAAVHDAAGGYPWFVQLWGRWLWDTLRQREGITAADVDVARPQVEHDRDRFYSSRWRRIPSGRARDLTRALAARGGTGAVGELLRDIGLDRHEQMSPARAALIDRGLVLAPSHGRLAFTVPGFDRWILETTP